MEGRQGKSAEAGRQPRHPDAEIPGSERGARAEPGTGQGVRLLGLLAYYVGLVALGAALVRYVPAIRHALAAPLDIPLVSGAGQMSRALSGAAAGASSAPGEPLARSLTATLVMAGTVALTLPVAWVYMLTHRFRYDRSFVQSLIILPLVVAGVVIVVKNSLSLAFALAGIVAAVRFRNTLKDPRDAVYIFLALGIGLAAGVQALDVALVTSVAFNIVVLTLWKYDVGALYKGTVVTRGALAVGDPELRSARSAEARASLVHGLSAAGAGMDSDGVLLVHTPSPDAVRGEVESALSGMAKEWRVLDAVPNTAGISTLRVLVRLKKRCDPDQLLGAIRERAPTLVVAVEYVPYPRKKDEER